MPLYSSIGGSFSGLGRAKRPFNIITGGATVTDVVNYNGTGETWRVHKFTSTGASSLVVDYIIDPVNVLIVAGGGRGGDIGGGGGGAGGMLVGTLPATHFPKGTYSLSVGTGGQNSSLTTAIQTFTSFAGGIGPGYNGGGGGSGGSGAGGGGVTPSGGDSPTGGSGGGAATQTSQSPLTGYGNAGGTGGTGAYGGGGGGGAGGVGGSPQGAGAGRASNITGASVTYASGASSSTGGAGAANTGNGGQPQFQLGGSGIIVVAYKLY